LPNPAGLSDQVSQQDQRTNMHESNPNVRESSVDRLEPNRDVEWSLSQLAATDTYTYVASLVQTIDTYLFTPPSPDTTGIAYLDSSDTLLVSDADVDETDLYTGTNVFEMTLSGTLIFTSTTESFSDEPEGIGYNPDDGHLFFADDDADRIYEVDPASNGDYDVIRSFSTTPFGSIKPLGVAYSADLEMLFIADFWDEVHTLTPGDNGVFDGVEPGGDDQWASFDTAGLGMTQLEGIAFNSETGLLYFVGYPRDVVAVTTIDGLLLQTIDISESNMTKPSGLTFGPSSSDSVTHIYIADRGTDVEIPDENDGKVYEMTLPPADTTPPETDLDSTPPDPDNDDTPTFEFSGSDSGGSGVNSFECRVDGGDWASCSSQHTTAPLSDGSHTFEVRAIDNFGNRDPSPASHTWTVDTTPPTTSLTSTPSDPDNDDTPTFEFSGSDPGGSGVDGFECQLDGSGWASCSSPHTTAALSDGSHTFEVRAVDEAGNPDATPAFHTWTVDTGLPDTIMISTPPDPDNDDTPTFTFTGTDNPGGTGVDGFECQVDGSGWASCSSPHTTPGLSDGPHTFEVRAVDEAGNPDATPASYTWTIDTVPPDTSLTSTPPDPDNDNTPAFSFTGSDPGGSGVDGFECQVDGSGWTSCSSPHTTPGLSDGPHTFEVRAIDSAGNTDATPASYTWTIDTAPLDTSFISTPPDPDNDDTPTFSFTGSDSDGNGLAGFECQVDGSGWYSCTSPYTTASLSDGAHTVEVRAVDEAGNRDPSPVSHTWTIDTVPPDTSLTFTPPTLDTDDTPTFTFEGVDDAGGSGVAGFECQVDGSGWTSCSSPHTTASLSDGSRTFEVRAVDAAGNQDASPASYTWTIDATAPDTSLTSTPSDPDNDNTPAFSFTGDDAGGSGVTGYECKLNGTGWTGCSSPYVTPGLSDGSHTFQVRAIDSAGNTDATPASYTWTIDTAPPDTLFTSTPPALDTDDTPTFAFTGTDDAGGTGLAGFECRVDGSGWSSCSSPHTTAPLGDGDHTFEVRAVDEAGNGDPSPSSYTWKVISPRVYLPFVRR
jgi:hypothetical protein